MFFNMSAGWGPSEDMSKISCFSALSELRWIYGNRLILHVWRYSNTSIKEILQIENQILIESIKAHIVLADKYVFSISILDEGTWIPYVFY